MSQRCDYDTNIMNYNEMNVCPCEAILREFIPVNVIVDIIMSYFHRDERDVIAELPEKRIVVTLDGRRSPTHSQWVFDADLSLSRSWFPPGDSIWDTTKLPPTGDETISCVIRMDGGFPSVSVGTMTVSVPKWGRGYLTPFARGAQFRNRLRSRVDAYGFTREQEIAFNRMCDLAHATIWSWLH
jgi:hypothetical protein